LGVKIWEVWGFWGVSGIWEDSGGFGISGTGSILISGSTGTEGIEGLGEEGIGGGEIIFFK